jgi:hypothetical protein
LYLEPICELRDCIYCLHRAAKPSGNNLFELKEP